MKANNRIILMTKDEVQSGLNRQRLAERLISQLPKSHDGRNSWLLNYGVSEESENIRKNHVHKPKWVDKFQAAETIR